MARFVFKLEGVLRHRQFVERQRQRELAELESQMSVLQNALRDLDQRTQSNTDDLRRNHLVGRLDLNYLAAHRRYVIATQRQAMELAQQMGLLQRQIDQARSALAESAKQRKIIEKLREKQWERWKADEDRREMIDLDEAAIQLSYAAAQAQADAQRAMASDREAS
jgi:flagellar protein FliJ